MEAAPIFAVTELRPSMRVAVVSLTVVAPTQGNVDEANATSTSNGVFFAVITGTPRPFREPGIELLTPPPSEAPATVPLFDENPERIRVDSDAQIGAPAINVATGQTITGMIGVLGYDFRTYTIFPDPAAPSQHQRKRHGDARAPAGRDEFTVASYNMERFFDTVNDPGVSERGLTATAFNNRLNKASLGVRHELRTPDILAVQEMENLTTLHHVRAKINNDAVAAGDPNPHVRGVPRRRQRHRRHRQRVSRQKQRGERRRRDAGRQGCDVHQPGHQPPEVLNDRPPLVLQAVVQKPGTSARPITVINNHLRSLNGVDTNDADGRRVRAKRRAQAEFLANLVQARQLADPNERILLVGDFNAFESTTAYVDSHRRRSGGHAPLAGLQVTLASPDLLDARPRGPRVGSGRGRALLCTSSTATRKCSTTHWPPRTWPATSPASCTCG